MGRPAGARTAHLALAVLLTAATLAAATAGRRPAALVATATALAVIGWQVLSGRTPLRAWRAVLLGVVVLTLDDVVLTCRAGLGTAVVRTGETVDLDALLSAADVAMYREKGRTHR